LQRSDEGVEGPAIAAEQHCEHVVARRQEDAPDLVAGDQGPVQRPPLARGRSPADVELEDAHEIGSTG